MVVAMIGSTVIYANYIKKDVQRKATNEIILPNLKIKNDQTGIPDNSLYKAIVFEIGDKKEPLINSEILSVKALNLQNKNICDITGIEKFINLQELNLGQNKIKDVKNISVLGKLQTLTLDQNAIDNLDGIENLKDLKALSLSENPLTKEEVFKKTPKSFSQNAAWLSQQNLLENEQPKQETPEIQIPPAITPEKEPIMEIPKPPLNYNNPQTFDTTNIILPIVLCAVAIAIIVLVIILRKKSNKNKPKK